MPNERPESTALRLELGGYQCRTGRVVINSLWVADLNNDDK